MAAVGLPSKDIEAALSTLNLTQTCIACYNSPTGQTISGAEVEVMRLKTYLYEKYGGDLFWRDIDTDKVAYHAPHFKCHLEYLIEMFSKVSLILIIYCTIVNYNNIVIFV